MVQGRSRGTPQVSDPVYFFWDNAGEALDVVSQDRAAELAEQGYELVRVPERDVECKQPGGKAFEMRPI